MDELERDLRGLVAPFASRHSAADVLKAHRRRRRSRRLAAAVLATVVTAGLVLAVLRPPSDGPLRERGSTIEPWVGLRAVAEGPAGLRPVADPAVLEAEEAVVFRIETNGPGRLSLDVDDGTRIWPPVGGEWEVDQGEHYVGDDHPLSWTPDADPSRPHRVTATFCPDETEPCAHASLQVTWRPAAGGAP